MPNQNKRPKSPSQGPEGPLEEYEKKKIAEIEKETKKEIFIERYKDKIFKWLKWGSIILVFIIIFATVINYFIVPGFIIKPQPSSPTPTAEKPKGEFKITVEMTKLIPDLSQENVYDVAARIKNPDPQWGISKFNYKFILKDFLGNITAEKEGQSYILPQQSRYIIELGIVALSRAENLEFKLELKEIQKLKEVENPQLQMKALGQNFDTSGQKTKVWADIYNESIFGFEKVEVNFILYDEGNNIVGVSYTNINAFASNTKRYVSAAWNYAVPAKISRIEIEPNVNVYESGAFMRQYGEEQTLQY